MATEIDLLALRAKYATDPEVLALADELVRVREVNARNKPKFEALKKALATDRTALAFVRAQLEAAKAKDPIGQAGFFEELFGKGGVFGKGKS